MGDKQLRAAGNEKGDHAGKVKPAMPAQQREERAKLLNHCERRQEQRVSSIS